MKTKKIPLELARRIAVNAQLLDGKVSLPSGKEGVAQAIEKLGYIQIDTIAVVERAHHHTLWNRCGDYDPLMLHQLQAKDRRIFEYWGHAASILPMCDYRYYLPRMRSFLEPKSKRGIQHLEMYAHLMEPVLQRIRDEGPLGSKDFKLPEGRKGGTWWDWKPAKVALELLFWRGELMITERRNFQRVYDLTERVLPVEVDTRYPHEGELGQFLVRRALSAYGVARKWEIGEHIRGTSRTVLSKSLNDLLDTGEVVCVQMVGGEASNYYMLTDTLKNSAKIGKATPQVFLLSPFDNLIIQRERIKLVFGFDYSLECYLPAAKRKYGYFVLPILYGEQLVGRLDAKADRKVNTLIVRNLFFEEGFDQFDEFLPAFVAKLWEFTRFNGCEEITIEKTTPTDYKGLVDRLL